MPKDSFFVSRTFYLKGDQNQKIVIQLSVPKVYHANGDYKCEFKISGGEDFEAIEFFGVGVDSLAAFFNALVMAKAHIEVINKKNFSGNLRWLNDQSFDLGLGF